LLRHCLQTVAYGPIDFDADYIVRVEEFTEGVEVARHNTFHPQAEKRLALLVPERVQDLWREERRVVLYGGRLGFRRRDARRSVFEVVHVV